MYILFFPRGPNRVVVGGSDRHNIWWTNWLKLMLRNTCNQRFFIDINDFGTHLLTSEP